MSLKHKDLDIPNDNPFANCKLDRKKYAEVLTDIVGSYSDGFVLAINNQWGAGKTTFVKMWQKHLEQEERGYKTIYFNAWENDFDNKPFIAITAEINTLIVNSISDKSKSLLKAAAKITKSAIPAIAQHLSNKYIGISSIPELAKDISEGALALLEEELKEYSKKKEGIEAFRVELAKYINQFTSDKPLVIIIDELDRCRPNYAVEVLENIKHLFSVKGIVFVLSIDKIQLGHAVRGVYGSEQIDADEYLKRFIDIEYNIPKPDSIKFIRYLNEYYSFDDFFRSSNRMKYLELTEDSSRFLLMAECLLSNLSLRQQEKIFIHSKIVINSFKENEYSFSHLLFFLVYLKVVHYDKYQKINSKEFSLQELSDVFGDIIISKKQDLNNYNFTYVQVLLIWFYNNNLGNKKVILFERTDKVKLTLPINSKLSANNKELENYFMQIDRSKFDYINLDYLLAKINLTERINY
jgi:hypothetical protein